MPNIETVGELAEAIADYSGVWGANNCQCGCNENEEWDGDHQDDCACRMCFVSEITRRIKESVNNSQILDAMQARRS